MAEHSGALLLVEINGRMASGKSTLRERVKESLCEKGYTCTEDAFDGSLSQIRWTLGYLLRHPTRTARGIMLVLKRNGIFSTKPSLSGAAYQLAKLLIVLGKIRRSECFAQVCIIDEGVFRVLPEETAAFRLYPRHCQLFFIYVHASAESRWSRIAERHKQGLVTREGNVRTFKEGPGSQRLVDQGLPFWSDLQKRGAHDRSMIVEVLDNSEPAHLESNCSRLVESLISITSGTQQFLFIRGKIRGVE